MELSLATYRMLVAIAQAEGGVNEGERALLSRYRRALGLPPSVEQNDFDRSKSDCPLLEETALWRRATPEQRAHLVRMLIRVAFADGVLGRRERRRLQRVSGSLGVSRMEFGSLLVDVEDELHRHKSGRLQRRVLMAVLAVAGGLVALFVGRGLGLFPGSEAAENEVFKAVEERARPALVLIQVDYWLRGPSGDKGRRGTGTGFFLNADGLIATNKHVLEPWKFDTEAGWMLASGHELIPEKSRVVAYPLGARVKNADGRRVTKEAFDTRAGTLRVVGFAPDSMQPRELALLGGEKEVLLHANDSADLALLQARVTRPVASLELRGAAEPVQTLEPVLVLGFPDGTGMLERGRVLPTVARGEVSRVEDMLLIQAPLLKGSSGGPVVDEQGRVVGIATIRVDKATFGRCIQVRHVASLAAHWGIALD